MESLEFIAIIACFAVVLYWYVQNVQAGSEGLHGLLALADDPDISKPAARRPSYRIKPRVARRAHEMRDANGIKAAVEAAKPAFHRVDEGDRMRRAFRRQDEARYHAKDKAASYKPRSDPTAA